MTKDKWMPTVVLSAICLIVAGLLAAINMVTGPRIAQMQSDKANAALVEVFPGGKGFEKMDLTKFKMPSTVVEGYTEESGGYVFQLETSGKASGFVTMCGIDKDGKIVGVKCIKNAETPSYFAPVVDAVEGQNGYYGQTLESFSQISVANSTMSSDAYGKAVKDALSAFTIANGGSVDLRTPEEILQENCNTALGTTGVTFEKWFVIEAIEGVDAVYTSTEGNVYVIGESFIGVKDGEVVPSDVEQAVAATVLAADEVVTGATLEDVDMPAGANANVISIKRTGSGNYVIEVKTRGYALDHAYGDPTKKPIVIRVCITADGKILSTLTVSETESDGIGDKCADPSYYEQYNGKDVTSYESVPQINGATVTSNAYKKGIQLAFDTFALVKGDQE